MGIRGIYTRVRMDCEKLGFFKTELAGGLTELRVPAVRQLNGHFVLFVL